MMDPRRLAIFLLLALAACNPPAPRPMPVVTTVEANPLLETRWLVSALAGSPPSPSDAALTLIFGGRDTVIGSGGCTGFRGPLSVESSTITLGPLSAGTASCGEAIDAQERAYLLALQAATTYQLDGAELILLDADGTELVRLSRAE